MSVHGFYRPHERVCTPVGEESMTVQSCKAECDINNILKQFQKTGIMTHINNHKAEYMDLPDSCDYQSALNVVLAGQDAFDSLPSKVRDYFENDPEKFLAAFGDEKMRPQLEEWGLLKPTRPPDPLAPASQPGTGEKPVPASPDASAGTSA